jgi:alpha-L-fucosidase
VGRNGVLLLNIPPDKRGLIHENDAASLREWKSWRDQIFAENLLTKAKWPSNINYCEKLVDGSGTTAWQIKQGDSTAMLEMELPASVELDLVSLQEDISQGQRVESFRIDYWQDNAWKELTKGTTIGYKRILSFMPVKTQKLRLVIESSRGEPLLSELGAFKMVEQK